jgi:serine/threonine protein kinase
MASAGGGDDPKKKMMTMMRLGELHCFEEEQRIAIMEMVKDGSMTIEQAQYEVKKARPKTFSGLKYYGSFPTPALTLRTTLTPEMGTSTVEMAAARLKRLKPVARKVNVTVSTVGIRIVDAANEDTIENEPIQQIAFTSVLPGDKKKIAYVTSYSKLGLLYTHIFAMGKSKDAVEATEAIVDRKTDAAKQKSLVPPTGIENMSAGVEEDDEEEELETGKPLGVFNLIYLGSVPSPDYEGSEAVSEAIKGIRDTINPKPKRKDSIFGGLSKEAPKESSSAGVHCVMVISSEGIRTIDAVSRDVMHNVIIKAISYSTEVVSKKMEMFAFIEVDDRRNSKDCHVFMCEDGAKGQALEICNILSKAFQIAVQEAKARAGNPFLPIGRERDKVEGPLHQFQFNRKDLRAIKAIGAGQFGRVYLASAESTGALFAVKMLRGGASTQDKTEFLRESETMLELGPHDNLVKFIGVCVKQRPWLVILEFCQYGDLSDVLRACRRKGVSLTPREQVSLTYQLACGMTYIAGKGFVHMDLAARNCLLDSNNNVKVADFGLTHRFDEGHNYYRQVGVMKLSIRWLAIDSFDHKIFSEKSDVWSFGITVWEIMTYGQQPYTGQKLTDVLRIVRAGTRPSRPENCSDAVWDIIQSTWVKEASKRPTFKKLMKSIQSLTEQDPGEIRNIGSLLNGNLTDRIKNLSVRVKKNSAAAAEGGPKPALQKGKSHIMSEEELTGVLEDEGEAPPPSVGAMTIAEALVPDLPAPPPRSDEDHGAQSHEED